MPQPSFKEPTCYNQPNMILTEISTDENTRTRTLSADAVELEIDDR